MPRLATYGAGHVLFVWEQHPASGAGNIAIVSRLMTNQ
jgi:hypothetical protein